MDLGGELAYCSEWGWVPPTRVEVAPLTLSRVLIDGIVRSRVRADIRNLHLLDATRITGLSIERERDSVRVTGVTTSHNESPKLEADLIVDASGRTSKCLEWLAAHGVSYVRRTPAPPWHTGEATGSARLARLRATAPR